MRGSNIVYIPLWSLIGRFISDHLFHILFPRTVIDKTKAIKKAETEAIKGRGLVVVYTHFSLRDAMEANRSIAFKNPVLRRREAINPLSYHQFNKPMELMAKFYSGDFYPVVNSSTVSKKGYEHLPKGKGLNEFMSGCAKVLQIGGIVPIAVNATRKEKLDMADPQKPIGYLIATMQSKGVKNFGFLFVGMQIKGAKSYLKKDIGGMNFRKVCIVNVAKYITLEDLLKHPEVNGKLSNVDPYIRSELSKVVAKEYL